MPLYQYTAHSLDTQQPLQCRCMADSADRIRVGLQRIEFTADKIYTLPPHASGQHKRITLPDLVSFCRRFAVMYHAGLPLLECLSVLAADNESQRLRETLQDIHDHIQSGRGVADAFGRHPRVFSPFFINMMRAGETAGRFDYVLTELASTLEKDYDLRRKLLQALAYPAVVMLMILGVVTTMMLVVVPVFSRVYSKMGIELPGPTLTLMAISRHADIILGGLVAVVIMAILLMRWARHHHQAAAHLDRWKIGLPIMGSLWRNILLLRFIQTLTVMIRAGISLYESIGVAQDVAHHAVVDDAAEMMQRSIQRGGSLTDAIRLHDFFPQTIVHAFAAGEESGDLDPMLSRFADGLERDVDEGVKKLVSKVEPVLVVILSLIVGFVLMAIYLPMFDLMKGLR